MIDVLIPSLVERKDMLKRLRAKLDVITRRLPVNVIVQVDNREMSIGAKRNLLLSKATSDYTMFLDDDDDLDRDAFKWIFKALEGSPDCVELKGLLTTDGRNPKTFIHSIDYDSYFEKNGVYYRPPNHLNPIKREIAQSYLFPENNFGEDTDWTMQIAKAKVLNSMGRVPDIWYYYNWRNGVSTTS